MKLEFVLKGGKVGMQLKQKTGTVMEVGMETGVEGS
jgi:hypothetical protein